MRKVVALIVSVVFSMDALSSSQFLIDSKDDAKNKLISRSLTYNMSYPDGPTTMVESTTYPPTTTSQTCPPVTTSPCVCEPQVEGVPWVYILTPIFSVVCFGAGILIGACAMKRARNRE